MPPTLSADDRLNIQDCLTRYAWSIDTADVEGFVACFCREGVLIWDAFETPDRWAGAEQLRAFICWLRDLPTSAGRQHHLTNVLISGTAEGARATAYVTVALRQAEGPHLLHVMGHYEDEFVLEDGLWRIRQHVIRDWSGPILKNFAGQTGERVIRQRPPGLKRGAV